MTPVCITLNPEQAFLLEPVLDLARRQNSYEGLLASVARVYSPQAGGSVLELQLMHVKRSKLAKLSRLLTE